ncbi:MAG: SoxR reducing system RseC family protein [Planctomycetes bacterium]|nr:SoxR reducing system RseC family protein [Planctomycetota bacterium]
MKYRSETAVVCGLEGDTFVLKLDKSASADCARCGLCNSADPGGDRLMRVDRSCVNGTPRSGDQVTVFVPDMSPAAAAVVLLGIPLLGGMAGITAGWLLLGLFDWAVVGSGVAGLAGAWSLSYTLWGRRARVRVECLRCTD